MRTLAENIALLLCVSDQALTIQKTDEGFIIALSDMEERDDDSLIFVPETVLMSPASLPEALESFYEHQRMYRVRGYHA